MEISITVDDLPIIMDDYNSTLQSDFTTLKSMISSFKSLGIQEVTGFLNGNWIRKIDTARKVLLEWKTSGFLLSNHGYSHLGLNSVPAEKFIQDIRKNESILKEFEIRENYRVFRYPYLEEGETESKIIQVDHALKSLGYRKADVTIDSLDWAWNLAYVGSTKKFQDTILKDKFLASMEKDFHDCVNLSQITLKRDIRQILLIHVTPFTAFVLQDLLNLYRRLGARFISLKDAIQDPVYSTPVLFPVNDGITFFDRLVRSNESFQKLSNENNSPQQTRKARLDLINELTY